MDPINLNTEPQLEQITLGAGTNKTTVAPDVADRRAFKAKYGQIDLPDTYADIKQGLIDGNEEMLRIAHAAQQDYQKQVRKNSIIQQFALQKRGPLTAEEMKYVTGIAKSFDSPSDPSSIWEEMYSTEYIGQLDKTINPDIPKEIPEEYAKIKAAGSHVTTIVELLKTAAEENEAAQKAQTGFGYAVDFAKNLSQLYQEFKLGGRISEGLLGSRMAAQSRELFRMQPPEAAKFIKENMTIFNRDNPQLGAQWLQYMIGQSTSEKTLANLMTVAATPITTLGAGAALVKGTRKLALGREAAKAVDSLVKQSANKEANPVAIAEASGDWAEGGIQKVAADLTQPVDLSDPTRGWDHLQNMFRTSANDYIGGSPNASTEVKNRLTEQADSMAFGLGTAIEETLKAGRAGSILEVEGFVRKSWDMIKNQYPGLENAIPNISVPYFEKLTGSMFVDFNVGRTTGEAFKTAKEAENFALQAGLQGRVVGQKGAPIKITDVEPSFTTTKGIKYKIGEGGSTTKVVKGKPGERSVQTVYVPKEALTETGTAMKATEGGYTFRLALDKGEIAFLRRSVDEPWKETHRIAYKTEPEKGYVAVELSQPKRLKAMATYGKAFISDEISEVVQKNQVVQQGNGYYVRIQSTPIPLDSLVVRDARKATIDTGALSWSDAWAGLFGKFRTPEEIFSLQHNAARKVATTAPAELFRALQNAAGDIDAIRPNWYDPPYSNSRKKFNQWNDVMKAAKHVRDPETGEPGHLFKTQADLELLYKNTTGRLPDDQEVYASFAWKNQQIAEKVFLNILRKRYKDGKGMKTWELQVIDPSTETKNAFRYKSMEVDGKKLMSLKDAKDDSLVRFGQRMGEETVTTTGKLRGKNKELTEAAIKDGRITLLELSDAGMRALEGFTPHLGNARFRYVLIPTVVEKPLTWDQLKNMKSPPDYDVKYYIKQAVLMDDKVSKKTWYERDKTFWALNHASMGKDVVQKLEKMRLLLREGRIDEARQANPLGMDFDDLRTNIDLNEPFVLVDRNQMVGDVLKFKDRPEFIRGNKEYRGEFRDGTTDYSRFFEGQRDVHELLTIENRGTKANPVYNLIPSKELNPMTAINRSLTRAVNRMYMDDYKFMAVEDWIQKAKGVLSASEADIMESPFYYFYNGKFKDGVDDRLKGRLEIERFQIRQFLGASDPVSSAIHASTQRLVDSIYDKGFKKTALAAEYTLPYLTNAPDFLRYMTFHAKLGLFAVPQLWVQAQGFTNVLAIAGVQFAAPAMKAYLFHTWARVNKNPAILDKLDELASKQIIPGTHNFRPGEFKEAHELMRRTGWGIVGGEYALYDNPLGFQLVTHAGKKFLNAGKFFFTEGERLVRQTSFYAAYLEHRAANPTGKIVDADLRKILQRADLLSINMTRASNSRLHEGIFSIPAQFLTYQLRMAELVVGKRLTTAEKARLWTWNAALYGIPTSLGITGLPAADWMRKEALVNGYKPGDKYIDTVVHEGIPAALIGFITGQWYNINERFGVQGMEQAREVLSSDTPFIKLVGGAAGSVIGNTVAAAHPLWEAFTGILNPETSKIKVTDDHIADVFKEISSFNSNWRAWAAWNTGIWQSKKGAPLSNTSPIAAIMQSVFGVQKSEVSDMGLFVGAQKDMKAKQTYVLNRVVQEARRAALNFQNNPEQASQHLANIVAWFEVGGYPIDKRAEALSIAMSGNEPLAVKIPRDFFEKLGQIPGKAQSSLEILQNREKIR